MLDGTLVVTLGYTPTAGQVWVIVPNGGTDPVTGRFAGLPEGATLSVGGRLLEISYVGGSGNDVALTDVTP